jgi:hypothetical protein
MCISLCPAHDRRQFHQHNANPAAYQPENCMGALMVIPIFSPQPAFDLLLYR